MRIEFVQAHDILQMKMKQHEDEAGAPTCSVCSVSSKFASASC